MQAGCEITRRLRSTACLPSSFHSVIQSESSEWATGVKDEFPSIFCVCVCVCVCVRARACRSLWPSASLAVASPSWGYTLNWQSLSSHLERERLRWVNSSSYILFYALRMSAYWKQKLGSKGGKLQKLKRRSPTTGAQGAGVKRKQSDRCVVK